MIKPEGASREFVIPAMTGDASKNPETGLISPAQSSAPAIYANRQNAVVWTALVCCLGFISAGASISNHSLALTAALLLGAAVVWYLGYWALSNTYYFISPTAVGFRDRFRSREIQFGEIQSVRKENSRYSILLVFTCSTRTVTIPVDPMNQSWLADVKSELVRRQIPFIPSV